MEKTQLERGNEIQSYFKAIDELVQLCTEAQSQIRGGQFRSGITYLENVVNNATYLRDNMKDE
tara:strand:+ start:386 stop:574 length:189 start_codon:yes stop_codon:yes gene_type:complete